MPVEWLNYHHLLYFWMVAREGGLAPASAKLRLAQPTLSGQIHALETALGEKLFTRSGRKLALTDVGRVAYRYADAIFSLGQEMLGFPRSLHEHLLTLIDEVLDLARIVLDQLNGPGRRSRPRSCWTASPSGRRRSRGAR